MKVFIIIVLERIQHCEFVQKIKDFDRPERVVWVKCVRRYLCRTGCAESLLVRLGHKNVTLFRCRRMVGRPCNSASSWAQCDSSSNTAWDLSGLQIRMVARFWCKISPEIRGASLLKTRQKCSLPKKATFHKIIILDGIPHLEILCALFLNFYPHFLVYITSHSD